MRRSMLAGLLLSGLVLTSVPPAMAGADAPRPAGTVRAEVTAASTSLPARTLLGRLVLAKESHASTYERAKFKHWIDADGDSCDTREEVLVAESTVKAKRGTSCKVLSGRWVSTYDGKVWTNPSDVDVDHLVALSEAWQSGAWGWTAAKRQRYANDLGYSASLSAMTDNLNSSKGNRDPAEWLPPKASTRCLYAIRWVAVKYRWSLRIDSTERTKLRSLFAGSCGDRSVRVPAKAS
jgi:hypothetical protein